MERLGSLGRGCRLRAHAGGEPAGDGRHGAAERHETTEGHKLGMSQQTGVGKHDDCGPSEMMSGGWPAAETERQCHAQPRQAGHRRAHSAHLCEQPAWLRGAGNTHIGSARVLLTEGGFKAELLPALSEGVRGGLVFSLNGVRLLEVAVMADGDNTGKQGGGVMSANESADRPGGRPHSAPRHSSQQQRAAHDEGDGGDDSPERHGRKDPLSGGSYWKTIAFNAARTLSVNCVAYYCGQFSAEYARQALVDDGWDANRAGAVAAMVNQSVQMFLRALGNAAAKSVQFTFRIPRIDNQSNTYLLEAIKGFVVSAAADQAGTSAKIPLDFGVEGNIGAGVPISVTADAIASVCNDLLATRQVFQPSLAEPGKPDCKGSAQSMVEQVFRRLPAGLGAAAFTGLTGNRHAGVLGVSMGSAVGGLVYKGMNECLGNRAGSRREEQESVTHNDYGKFSRPQAAGDRLPRGLPEESKSREGPIRAPQPGFDPADALRAELARVLGQHGTAHIMVDARALGIEEHSNRFDGQLPLEIRAAGEAGGDCSSVEVHADGRALGKFPLAVLARARVDDEPIWGTGSKQEPQKR